MTTLLRSQATDVPVGVLVKPPLTQVSWDPVTGVPLIVGSATGTGAWTMVAAWTTRMLSGPDLVTLPALSTASAVSTTVVLAAEAGGKYRNWNGYTGAVA